MSYIREKRMSRGLKQALDSEEDVQDRFLAAEDEEFDNFSENLTLKIENQEVLNQSMTYFNCLNILKETIKEYYKHFIF